MDDPYSCTICFNYYQAEGGRRPKQLPCGHGLCGVCLVQLPKRECPTCKTSLPDTLPWNHMCIAMIEYAIKQGHIPQEDPIIMPKEAVVEEDKEEQLPSLEPVTVEIVQSIFNEERDHDTTQQLQQQMDARRRCILRRALQTSPVERVAFETLDAYRHRLTVMLICIHMQGPQHPNYPYRDTIKHELSLLNPPQENDNNNDNNVGVESFEHDLPGPVPEPDAQLLFPHVSANVETVMEPVHHTHQHNDHTHQYDGGDQPDVQRDRQDNDDLICRSAAYARSMRRFYQTLQCQLQRDRQRRQTRIIGQAMMDADERYNRDIIATGHVPQVNELSTIDVVVDPDYDNDDCL